MSQKLLLICQWFTVALGFLVLTVIVTYPTVLNLSHKLIGDGGDNIEYYSYFFLVRENVLGGNWPFAETNTFRYPIGFDLGAGSDARLMTFLGGIGLLFYEGPIVYNLLFFLIITLNCLAAYVFFLPFVKSKSISFIGGAIYGLSYYVLSRGAGHFNLIQVYGFPLLGLVLFKLDDLKQFSTSWFGYFFGALLLLALSSVQYFLIGLGLVIIYFLFLFPKLNLYGVKFVSFWKQSC